MPYLANTDRHTTTAPNLPYSLFLAGTAGVGGLLFGFDVGIITGAGPFLTERFGLNDLSLGWAYSSLLFGCALGCVIAGRSAERFGRRAILLGVALLFALTSVVTGLAGSFSMFVIARFAGGLAVGGASILSPIYISEISPARIRGRMGTLYQLSIVIGILISYCVNYTLRNIGANNWRWMFASGVVPSVIFFAMLWAAPETPRFLLKAGRDQEAKSLLLRIGGFDNLTEEVSRIRASFVEGPARWNDVWRFSNRRPLLVSFALAILIHVSGINTVIDYAPAIFQTAGWSINAALLSTFAVGITNVAFTLISFAIIDRVGRRPVYIVGSLGMAVSLCLLVTAALTGHFHGLLVIGLILVYLSFFCACVGPVFWTLLPEILPNHIRATAMTIPVLTQWIANALVVLVFPLAFHRIGTAITFGFLAAMCLLQALMTAKFVPETRHRSLEEIEQSWHRTAISQIGLER